MGPRVVAVAWRAEGGVLALSSTDRGATTELDRLPHFQAALDAASRAQKGTRRSGRLALLALITAFPLLALLVVLAFRDPIIDFVLERIPVSVDREVGKMFEGEILEGGGGGERSHARHQPDGGPNSRPRARRSGSSSR